MHVSEARARELFDPYLLRMAMAIARGDADLRSDENISPMLRARMSRRTLANNRYDSIMWHMRSMINSQIDPDVRWDTSTQTELLVIRDEGVCRFKRVNYEYLSRNYPTVQALAFADQDSDLAMEGMPPKVARFTVGWQTDSFERAVQGRYLIQPNGTFGPQWVISLDERAGQGIIPLRQDPRPGSGPRPNRIQPKGPGKKDATADQS
jgi:hypothetical protein